MNPRYGKVLHQEAAVLLGQSLLAQGRHVDRLAIVGDQRRAQDDPVGPLVQEDVHEAVLVEGPSPGEQHLEHPVVQALAKGAAQVVELPQAVHVRLALGIRQRHDGGLGPERPQDLPQLLGAMPRHRGCRRDSGHDGAVADNLGPLPLPGGPSSAWQVFREQARRQPGGASSPASWPQRRDAGPHLDKRLRRACRADSRARAAAWKALCSCLEPCLAGMIRQADTKGRMRCREEDEEDGRCRQTSRRRSAAPTPHRIEPRLRHGTGARTRAGPPPPPKGPELDRGRA
mmetsp:Transcript_58506/g.164013  ORF Transcript_58506/g.164013 Transcript_58506/m.164013 type:complete len:287 (+) Transcript_58506:501-1361(+)